MIIVPTKLIQGFIESGMKTEALFPSRATNKCISTQDKISLVGKDLPGRSLGIPGTEQRIVSEAGAWIKKVGV